MQSKDAERYATAAPLLRYARRALAARKHGGHGGGDHSTENVREAEHRGHRIVVRTRYDIAIDGKPLATSLSVDNDGNVMCHALPNYSFVSAVELVKQIIDLYPDAFHPAAPSAKKVRKARKKQGTRHGGHR